MKKHLVSLLLATYLCAPMSAHAEEFYIELGRTGSESDARAMWEELQGKYKFLAGYDVYPNQILQGDGTFTYRVQAGPVENKQKAQRLCNRLFRRQIACFVIEGFDPRNSKTFEQGGLPASGLISRSDFVSPPIVQAPAAQPVAAEEKNERPNFNAKANVEVAEAIAVPLSTDTESVNVAAPAEVAEAVSPADAPKPSADAQRGWLSVQPFLDEKRAREFWRDMQRELSREQRELTVRVIHPLVSHDVPKVILALGPFASEQDAMDFCRARVPASTYLECRFSAAPPDGDEASDAPSPSKTARATPGDEFALYWVELPGGRDQDQVLERWERIRTDNDDLLSDVRSQITTSMGSAGLYSVRIGPLKSKTKAGELCDALKARKVRCKLSSL